MSIELRIAGGEVVTPAGRLRADVLVDDGVIAGLVAPDVEVSDVGATIDVAGKVVLPGMVDPHVHTREPGFTHKEDITTSTQAAAAGGVTTIFGMPNLEPPTSSAALLDDVFELYRAKSVVDFNHNPAATVPGEVPAMAERGIRAFKVFMVVDTGRTYPHPAGTGMHDHGDLLRMMDTIRPTGLPFMIHPHDQALMDYIEGEILARGDNTPQGYAKAYAARDGVIWDTAVDTLIRLSEAADCPVHLMHMQTRRSIDAVRRAKARGLKITCEVNHWTLFLATWEDVERLGPYALSYWLPDDARAAVWEGLLDGTIDMLSSDHAPHTREEKEVGWTKMWSAHTGTPGVQWQLPLLLDAATRGQLSLERAVELTASRPAEVFGLRGRKGTIAPGYDADFAIVDLDAPFTITDAADLSRCGWTPYDGRECRVRVERTILRGGDVYVDGEVVGAPGSGRMATAGASAKERV
jgi:dihydroorotase (multifunctional complex type)